MSEGRRDIPGTRRLRVSARGNRWATVTLGVPRREGRDWACSFRISGLGERVVDDAYGVDAIQAVQVALDGIRAALEGTGQTFSWLGLRGETGFPRFVPHSLGLEFAERINRFMDRETNRFVRSAERKSKTPRSGRASQNGNRTRGGTRSGSRA